MKKLFLVAVLSSAMLGSFAQALSMPAFSIPQNIGATVRSYAPAVLGVSLVAGVFYALQKHRPYALYGQAKNTCARFDKNVTALLKGEQEQDVIAAAFNLYLQPSCALVDAMFSLEAEQRALIQALEGLEIALTLCNEKTFVQDSMYLKNKMQVRLDLINTCIKSIRGHSLWAQQSSLYNELERIRRAKEEKAKKDESREAKDIPATRIRE